MGKSVGKWNNGGIYLLVLLSLIPLWFSVGHPTGIFSYSVLLLSLLIVFFTYERYKLIEKSTPFPLLVLCLAAATIPDSFLPLSRSFLLSFLFTAFAFLFLSAYVKTLRLHFLFNTSFFIMAAVLFSPKCIFLILWPLLTLTFMPSVSFKHVSAVLLGYIFGALVFSVVNFFHPEGDFLSTGISEVFSLRSVNRILSGTSFYIIRFILLSFLLIISILDVFRRIMRIRITDVHMFKTMVALLFLSVLTHMFIQGSALYILFVFSIPLSYFYSTFEANLNSPVMRTVFFIVFFIIMASPIVVKMFY